MSQEEQLGWAYNAYCVDLIRTAGVLLRTTPSVIYRASTLLQRFQQSVNETFRASYSSTPEVEYIVPDHVGREMSSGLEPLADLFAPLPYCVANLIRHEDVTYLTAACLLIAIKMDENCTRLQSIVNLFMRLSQRRCGTPVNDLLQPPQERYHDFKKCVIEAEELVLHQLGFQSFVECPYKFVVVFLRVLVEEATTPEGQEAYAAWLVKAVSWLNDVPRFPDLVNLPAAQLSVFAILFACPQGVVLPEGWHTAFGVSAENLQHITKIDSAHRERAPISAPKHLNALRAAIPEHGYLTKAQQAEEAAQAEGKRRLAEEMAAPLPTNTNPTPPPSRAPKASDNPSPVAPSPSLNHAFTSSSDSSCSDSEDSLTLEPRGTRLVRLESPGVKPTLAMDDSVTAVLLSIVNGDGIHIPMPASPKVASPLTSSLAPEEDGCIDIKFFQQKQDHAAGRLVPEASAVNFNNLSKHRRSHSEGRSRGRKRRGSRGHSRDERRRRRSFSRSPEKEPPSRSGPHDGFERLKRYGPHGDRRRPGRSKRR